MTTPEHHEIERTFLVATCPGDLAAHPHQRIRQGYITTDGPALRLRCRGTRCELTRKSAIPGHPMEATELTLPLSHEECTRLWPAVRAAFEKTRYAYPLTRGLTADLDVYHGSLTGLIAVDVEFGTADEAARFVPPSWFGREVTDEPWATGAFLAGKTWDELRPYLEPARPPG